MEKDLIDCKNEVEDELEEGEIRDEEETIVMGHGQNTEKNIYKDNRDGIQKRGFDCHRGRMNYDEEEQFVTQKKVQNIYKKTYYNQRRAKQQNDRNGPRNYNGFERRNFQRNADYNTMNDIPRQNNFRRNRGANNNNVMFRNNQHYFREPRNFQDAYNNGNKGYKNYFDQTSRNITENYSVPKINTKNIPSLLDMIIPVPPEFQKLNNTRNNNDNSAPMQSTLRNNLVVDNTSNINENSTFHSSPKANITIKDHKDNEKSTIEEKQEEKEEEVPTPYNYHFTLDSSDDEFNDLIKNGEHILVQKPAKIPPTRNTIQPEMTPPAHQQIMTPNSQRLFRGPRNPRQRSRYFPYQRKNYNF